MKFCLFCKQTVSSNHHCFSKPAGLFPNKASNYPNTKIVQKSTQSLNSPNSIPFSSHSAYEKSSFPNPKTKNYYNSNDLSTESKILQKVLNFLTLFTPYTRFLNSHDCENFCFACIAKSYYQDPNPNYITMANSSISEFFNTTPDFIDFPNCLSIILNLLHSLYLKNQANKRDICNFMCASHKIFGFTIFIYIDCECKGHSEKSLNPSYFTLNFTVTQEFALSKKKNIMHEHLRKIKYCPLNCIEKSSKITSTIGSMGEVLMVKLKYEERFSEKLFEKFQMFDDGRGFWKLIYFVSGNHTKIFVSDERGKVWNEHLEENRIINIASYLEQQNDYPQILVYRLESNY